MTADITIVGLGLSPADHLTPEAEAAVRAAREVLFTDTNPGTAERLAAWCPRVTPLYEHVYVDGANRLAVYHETAIRVVEAALDHRPIVWAKHGHALVFSYVPSLVRDLAELLGLSVAVVPGISTLDLTFARSFLDPGVNGLLVYEATDLLLRRRQLLADVPTLLLQVGNLETRLHDGRPSAPARLHRLRSVLREVYPADHPVIAWSFGGSGRPDVTWRFRLDDLPDHAPSLHTGVTLLVPPARTRPVVDRDLLAALDDPEHLDRVTLPR